jgi:broad specificity phosphatase PhoE
MKIYLLTHFTEIDKTDFSSSLDINGLKEADNIVERLGKLSIDKIYCSPFLKAMQSVYPFCKAYNKQINPESTFHDAMYNPIETRIDMHERRNFDSHYGYNYLYDSVNKHYKSKLFSSNVPLIETETTVTNRIFPFFYNLCHRYKDKNKNILIVSHQPIIDVILKFFVSSANCSVVANAQITEINIGEAWTRLKC